MSSTKKIFYFKTKYVQTSLDFILSVLDEGTKEQNLLIDKDENWYTDKFNDIQMNSVRIFIYEKKCLIFQFNLKISCRSSI
jgi:hypothetical protein